MSADVEKDFLAMGCLVLVCKVITKLKKILVRGEIISTYQPYRPDEKWETTFSCESNQFVEVKFDTIDFSQIALDIIKVQLLNADLSMPYSMFYF